MEAQIKFTYLELAYSNLNNNYIRVDESKRPQICPESLLLQHVGIRYNEVAPEWLKAIPVLILKH